MIFALYVSLLVGLRGTIRSMSFSNYQHQLMSTERVIVKSVSEEVMRRLFLLKALPIKQFVICAIRKFGGIVM